ncbi:hypothetical protein NP493_296g02037 [Ridgeia piscesae]|uniref:tRNA pseudouridine(55) synthase n=1 Tax=Ridgeia piscesae TaxID=27915 RepID=A0AAD9NWI9_RIDPI|nr:hypothetical protein NP493_296g02037 [Ridgeia piscesae]
MTSTMQLSRLCGVFAVIKPTGITSAKLGDRIRDDLQKEIGCELLKGQRLKIGHGGTLDMFATGVMCFGLGAGCKQLHALLHGKKRYMSTCRLGVATETYGAESRMTKELPYSHVTRDQLQEAISTFTGQISQMPPVFSALKHKGRRLSDMARAGDTLPEIQPRLVQVDSITCLDFSPPYFTLDIKCGGGFYVRSLVHNLGEAVASCAHVVALERTEHGPFTRDDAIPEYQWTLENVLTAIDAAEAKFGDYTKDAQCDVNTVRISTRNKGI